MMNEFEAFLQRQCRLLKHSEVSEAMEYSLMGKGNGSVRSCCSRSRRVMGYQRKRALWLPERWK